LGELGSVALLNWLVCTKRWRNTASHVLMAGKSYCLLRAGHGGRQTAPPVTPERTSIPIALFTIGKRIRRNGDGLPDPQTRNRQEIAISTA